jgi:hypothetical protein
MIVQFVCRRSARRASISALLPVIAVLALAGCSSDSSNNSGTPNNTSTAYEGILVGPGDSGALSITIASSSSSPTTARVITAATQAAVGQLKLVGGCTVDLTGALDGSTLAVAGNGACGAYSLVGALDTGRIEGSFTGPAGRTGTFVALLKGSSSSVQTFCGTWVEIANGTPNGASGPWNMVIEGASLAGVAYDSHDDPLALTGSVSGSNVTILFAPTQQQIATGTISGTSISGTFDITAGGGGAGTWSGGPCE